MKQPTIESHLFQPQYDGAEKLLPVDGVILIGTPVASLVMDGKGQLADTGVQAQQLANLLGSSVMAYQELGPKVSLLGLPAARRRLTPQNFPEYTAECAQDLRQKLAEAGKRNVVIRAHSGNGPLGTGLCLALPNEDVKVTHLGLSDPAGLQEVSFLRRFWLLARYISGPRKNIPPEHKAPPEHPSNTFRAFLGDVAVRGTTTWLSEVTLQNLMDIAAKRKQTAVNIHLPGNTLNGSAKQMKDIARNLNELGKLHRGETDARFRAGFVLKDFHSSAYDNTLRGAAFMRETVRPPVSEV